MATAPSPPNITPRYESDFRPLTTFDAGTLSISAVPDRAAEDGPSNPIDVALLLGRFGTGGVERVGCMLQNGFSNRGLRTEVVVVEADGPTAQLLSQKVRLTQIGTGLCVALSRSVGLLLSIPALAAHLRSTRPRVLLSAGNHTHVAATLGHFLAGSASTRLVLKITNPIHKERQGALRRWLRQRFYCWAFGRAAQILVLSRHGERQVGEISKKAAAKTRFVHNPYLNTAVSSQSTRRTRSDGNTILSVGRLTAQKNHTLLLRALGRLTHLQWRLVLLGEGPLEHKLRALAGELGIAGRIEFRGFVADPDRFYRQADMLALSSDWEDLPAVVLEALALGVPVVATACSHALTDVMRQAAHGQLVPTGDEAAFATALEQVIIKPPPRTPFAGAQRYSIENGIDDHFAALQPLLR